MTDFSKFKVSPAFRALDPNKSLADGISGGGFSSIRYRSQRWSLQHAGKNYPFKRDDDGTPLSYVDVIILGISEGISKIYFGPQGDWNEDTTSGPICSSLKYPVVDLGVSIPQAKSCSVCPHDEWRRGDRRGKECQDHKRMAVLLTPTMTKKLLGGTALLEPVFLKIPPASLTSLKAFDDDLQQAGIPFASVITRIAFSTEKQWQMTFDIVQSLSDAEFPRVKSLMDTSTTKRITGEEVVVRQIKSERVETGLLEAFDGIEDGNLVKAGGNGTAAPAPKATRKARAPKVIEAEPDDYVPTHPPREIEPNPASPEALSAAGPDAPWEESDDDLDDTVAKLMADKTSNMLK